MNKLPSDFNYIIYRELNDDLKNFNEHELISHFLHYGILEKRKYKIPDDFNVSFYRELNDDLKNFNDRELISHFLHYGIREKRKYKIQDDFNVSSYRELNDDLKNFNERELISHFLHYGIREKRKYKYDEKTNDDDDEKTNDDDDEKTNDDDEKTNDEDEKTNDKLKIIVARYNEDISNFAEFNDYLLVYNKGNNDINSFIKKECIKNVPNLGREAGTYCNYILDNYNNLPDYMIFTQGNPCDHVAHNDPIKTFDIIREIVNEDKKYKFKYISGHIEKMDLDAISHYGTGICITPIEYSDPKNINELIEDIRIWVHKTCPEQAKRSYELINKLEDIISRGNKNIFTWEFNKILIGTEWYCTSGEAQIMRYEITKHNFNYSKIKKLIDSSIGFSYGYGAIFIVHRDNILKYNRDFWQRLFDSLQELLPTSGWGCERLWGFLLGEGDFYQKI
jgi:hypothetical protein